MGVLKMGMNKLMSKAQELKEDTLGTNQSQVTPREIYPEFRSWGIALVITMWASIVVETYFDMALVIAIFLLTNLSFFRAKVKI